MDYKTSSQTASWFKDQYLGAALVLKPPFQRKPVWRSRQKCYLIESILLGYPVPEIYVQRTTSPTGETRYAIVDGQQRIRAILQFVGVDNDEPDSNGFALERLLPESPWSNLRFEELSDAEKVRIFDYELAVRYLNTNSDEEVREVFRRLNKFLSPLTAQELRNATYVGPFVNLALRLADSDYWVENKIVTAAAIRRMGDVEFMSELLIGDMHGPQGGARDTVDEYYARFEDYDEFPGQRRAQRLFSQTLSLLQVILPDIRDTRWSNKTDFYSLFVAVAALLRGGRPSAGKVAALRKRLDKFESDVNAFLSSKARAAAASVRRYVLAVEKGANDKMRRVQRHEALLEVLKPYFHSAD